MGVIETSGVSAESRSFAVHRQFVITIRRSIGYSRFHNRVIRKRTADVSTQTNQRMCIDSLTNSVTVYWMIAPGKVNSKTFRAVAALQEWFKLSQEAIVPR